MPRFLVFALLLALSVATARTPLSPPPAADAEQDYYFDLFAHTAKTCALPHWREINDAVAVGADPALVDNAGLYAATKSLLPVLDAQWTTSEVVLGPAPALALSTQVEHYVLVEIENTTNASVELQAWFALTPASSPTARPSNVAVVPPGVTRGLLTPVRVDALATTQVTLAVREVGSSPRYSTVPVAMQAHARLLGTLVDDDTGLPFPGRLWAECSDDVFRRGLEHALVPTVTVKPVLGAPSPSQYVLPFSYSSAQGEFELIVPAGSLTLTLERGPEFDLATTELTLAPGELVQDLELGAGRFADMRAEGWVSGDTHVHWTVIDFSEDEDYGLLEIVQRAEDVRVVNNLTLAQWAPTGNFVAPDAFPPGPVPAHSDADYLVQQGEEYRSGPFYGHLDLLDIDAIVQPISTGALHAGPGALDYPPNYPKALEAKAQGGTVLAAHGLVGSAPAELVLGAIDGIDRADLLQYYGVLSSGLRAPMTAGSDHPARPLGDARTYVKIDGSFSFDSWIEGLRAGRTFITSGPLLELTVDGVEIGGEVLADAGDTVTLVARARSRRPIGRLQILSSGGVLHDEVTAERELVVQVPFTADQSRWIVARCSAGGGEFNPRDVPDAAHTGPVWLTVDGERIFDAASAAWFEGLCEDGADEIEAFGTFANDAQRQEAKAVFDAGAQAWADLALYPDFSASPRSGLAPLAVQFVDESTNSPTVHEWDFDDDGAIDSGASDPAFVYGAPGTYTVRLATPGAAGDDEDVKQDYIEVLGMTADVASISLSAGGTQTLSIGAGPEHAGRVHLVLGTWSGTSPGFAVDGVHVPLSVDPWFTFTLKNPNTPPLDGTVGVLDSQGAAVARIAVPPGSSAALAGLELHHACLVVRIPGLGDVAYASNPVPLELLP